MTHFVLQKTVCSFQFDVTKQECAFGFAAVILQLLALTEILVFRARDSNLAFILMLVKYFEFEQSGSESTFFFKAAEVVTDVDSGEKPDGESDN